MNDQINDVTFHNMIDRDKFVYLMKNIGSNWVNIYWNSLRLKKQYFFYKQL